MSSFFGESRANYRYDSSVASTYPIFVAISVSSSGDNTIVSGSANKQIRVLDYTLVCAAAVVLTWKSSAAGAISGPMAFGANGGVATPYSPAGKIQTAVSEGLVLNLGGNISVGGHLSYILV